MHNQIKAAKEMVDGQVAQDYHNYTQLTQLTEPDLASKEATSLAD